jgi:hypothetical protein
MTMVSGGTNSSRVWYRQRTMRARGFRVHAAIARHFVSGMPAQLRVTTMAAMIMTLFHLSFMMTVLTRSY